MYESNVGSTGKANDLFIDSSSQPAWVAVFISRTRKVGTENTPLPHPYCNILNIPRHHKTKIA